MSSDGPHADIDARFEADVDVIPPAPAQPAPSSAAGAAPLRPLRYSLLLAAGTGTGGAVTNGKLQILAVLLAAASSGWFAWNARFVIRWRREEQVEIDHKRWVNARIEDRNDIEYERELRKKMEVAATGVIPAETVLKELFEDEARRFIRDYVGGAVVLMERVGRNWVVRRRKGTLNTALDPGTEHRSELSLKDMTAPFAEHYWAIDFPIGSTDYRLLALGDVPFMCEEERALEQTVTRYKTFALLGDGLDDAGSSRRRWSVLWSRTS